MRRRALGGDSGQTAVDYVGILVLVVLIVLALLEAGLGQRLVGIAGDAVPAIQQRGEQGAPAPGRSGAPGAGRSGPGGAAGHAPEGPGGSGSAPGDAGPGANDWIPCNAKPELPGCGLQVAVAPNGFREGIRDRARQRFGTAMRNIRNTSARPGSPEYERLRTEVRNARADLVRSRAITEHVLLRTLAGTRKFFDPRYKDLAPALQRFRSGIGRASRDAPIPGRPSTAPAARAGSRFLGGLGTFGKGLGAVGLAFGAYSNVRSDGVGKGLTKTAAATVGGWAAATGVGMACAAVGVATAGVGAVACGVGALAASVGAGMVASKVAGWAWDRGSDAVTWTGRQISRGASSLARKAAGPLKAAGSGLARIGGALKPGFL